MTDRRSMVGTMGIEVSGKLHAIFDTVQVTQRFQKREFVVELADNPRYPQHVLFQLTGDRVDHLDGFEVGDEVRIEFSLRGREWTSPKGEVKFFNSLDVWNLERLGARAAGGDEPPPPTDVPFDVDAPRSDFDDMPF